MKETQKKNRKDRLQPDDIYNLLPKQSSKPVNPVKFRFNEIKFTREQRVKERLSLTRRISPFLLLIGVFVVLFPYLMITGSGSIQNFWLLLFLFPCLICNLFLVDVAIWKYFSAKKVIPIWVAELSLSVLLVYLLV